MQPFQNILESFYLVNADLLYNHRPASPGPHTVKKVPKTRLDAALPSNFIKLFLTVLFFINYLKLTVKQNVQDNEILYK